MKLIKPGVFVGAVLISYLPSFFFATTYPIIINALRGQETDYATIFMVPFFYLTYMSWLYLPQLILLTVLMFLTSKLIKESLVFLGASMIALYLLSSLPLGFMTMIGPAIIVLIRFKQMPVPEKPKTAKKLKTRKK